MNNINGLPIYKWIIDENGPEGVSMMSIVDDPAVERTFAAYSKQKKVCYHVDMEKKIVTGVAIRADFPIYRNMDGEEFYTVFDKDVIEKIVHKFMKERRNCDVNINHSDKPLPPDKAYLFESFILREKDCVAYSELKGVEAGSWIVSYKIECPDLWNEIKAGKLNGFSIEIYGSLVRFKKQEKPNTKELIKLYNILQHADS